MQVLDAPALQDDFYLNLVDWSSQNTLAVGLGSCVYLWSACTSKVSRSIHPHLPRPPNPAILSNVGGFQVVLLPCCRSRQG